MIPTGHMILHDRVEPPLEPGHYRLRASTDAIGSLGDAMKAAPLDPVVRHLHVVGPRFSFSPGEIAGVFPPKDSTGAFAESLPHIVLGRRTLAWERPLDPAKRLPVPPAPEDDLPPLHGDPPWLALLLLEEGENFKVLTNTTVGAVLPPAVLADLPDADGKTPCVGLEIAPGLLRDLLPTVAELELLAHAREVNVDDRELSAGDADGFFAVVMSNRIPAPGKKHRVCLVSLEGRTDILRTDEPLVDLFLSTPPHVIEDLVFEDGRDTDTVVPRLTSPFTPGTPDFARAAAFLPAAVLEEPHPRLVLLHSWTFTCDEGGTFEELCGTLDIGLFGEVRGDWPAVADTGHLALRMKDRAGADQRVWYRGPLTPFPVTRDPEGPYHTADQCRRVSPETGMEDVSYAAAFEVGRLLAASDARLAQDLARWRRGDFRRSVERSVRDRLALRLPGLPLRPELLAAGLAGRLVREFLTLPRVDPAEWGTLGDVAGLRPDALATAWGPEAAGYLGAGPEALSGFPGVRPAVRGPVSLGGVRADRAGLARLTGARTVIQAFQAGLAAGVRGGG